jgi:filamentous hemagglutinin family protein
MVRHSKDRRSLKATHFNVLLAVAMSANLLCSPAYANPEGATVVGGSATISAAANKLDIHQQSSRAVIDWRSFDIDVGEHTQFHQPSANATVLNRVNNADPSRILGKLSANGNVVLINPNGVFFGQQSRIDVNGLVATTADISSSKFMDGSNHFDKPGNPNAVIINEGIITAKEVGMVGLVAPNIINSGLIVAKMGRVQLASGDTFTLDFHGDGLLQVEVVDPAVKSQLVDNIGKIDAAGGTIALTAAAAKNTIKSLIIVEGELSAPTLQNVNGKIIIAAAGSNKTEKDGSSIVITQSVLNASGREAGEQGCSIEILADHIALLDGTILDTSGNTAKVDMNHELGTATMTADKAVRSEADFFEYQGRAGGSIKVGGDYLGKGYTQTAKTLYVAKNALILNDAIQQGDAGRSIFWSDETTDFNGFVLARGGINGGSGGFLETSGKINLNAKGFADLSNSHENGSKGTYLLDPANITIYGNFDPEFISTDASLNLDDNLLLWQDASDATTILDADGDNAATGTGGNNDGFSGTVATWQDKSGNSNHLTAENTPTYTVNGLGTGLNSITLDGSDAFEKDGLNIDPNGDGFTLFSAFNFKDGDGAIFNWGTPDTNSVLVDHLGPHGVLFGRGAAWVGLNDGNRYLGTRGAANANTLVSVLYDGGSNSYLDANGLEVYSTGSAGYTTNDFNIGRRRDGNGQYANGEYGEIIAYDKDISSVANGLIEQYQAAKWVIDLDPITGDPLGGGGAGIEFNEATASTAKGDAADGYDAFTTRYLEKLSDTADIVLAADNTIIFDLKGDTLSLANDRNITLTTTNGDITDASTGTLRTNRTGAGGNITMTAGGAGNINIDTMNLEALGGGVINLSASGGNIDIKQAGALSLGTVTANAVTIQTTAATDITLNNTITRSNSGNAITIASGGNFINNLGAAVFNTTDFNGRYLVYSDNPANNTLNGLSSTFKRYNKTYAGYAPAAVTEIGDGLLYSLAPTLNIFADDFSRDFGVANPTFTYTLSGLIDGDTASNALNALPSLTSTAVLNSIGGDYDIESAALVSDLGYAVNFTKGTLTVSSKIDIPSSWEHTTSTPEAQTTSLNIDADNQAESDAYTFEKSSSITSGYIVLPYLNASIEEELAKSLQLKQNYFDNF